MQKSLLLEALEIVTCHRVGGCLKRMSLFQNRRLELYFTPSEDQVGVGNNLIYKLEGLWDLGMFLVAHNGEI